MPALHTLAAAALALASHLTFNATFDGPATFTNSPDGSSGVFMTTYPYGGAAARTEAGNNEAECYTDSSVGTNPFNFGPYNNLLLTAAPSASNPCGLPFTSALVTTYGSFSQTYGYFEIMAVLPGGSGMWPAFWMLPLGAYRSELDVFEQVGVSNIIYSTVHGADASGNWAQGAGTRFTPVPLSFDSSKGYHRYGVDWEPDNTTFYVDGVATVTVPTPVTMNSPMYLLANLAVGGAGSWPGPTTASTKFPAYLRVHYIRAYYTAGTTTIHGSAALRHMN